MYNRQLLVSTSCLAHPSLPAGQYVSAETPGPYLPTSISTEIANVPHTMPTTEVLPSIEVCEPVSNCPPSKDAKTVIYNSYLPTLASWWTYKSQAQLLLEYYTPFNCISPSDILWEIVITNILNINSIIPRGIQTLLWFSDKWNSYVWLSLWWLRRPC